MADITLTIPDAQMQRVISALTANRFDPVTLKPIAPTPANAKAVLSKIIKDLVEQNERAAAVAAIPPPDTTNLVT